MKLNIDYIKANEARFVVMDFPKDKHGKPDYYATSKLKVERVWICNPFPCGTKWRNCEPKEAVILDVDHYPGDWKFTQWSAQNDPNPDNRLYYQKFKHGYFAFSISGSMWDGFNYYNNRMFDLKYCLDPLTKKETNYNNSSTGKNIDKYFAVFDNKKEAKKYIDDIKSKSNGELDRLLAQVQEVEDSIKTLQIRKDLIINEINKFKAKKS